MSNENVVNGDVYKFDKETNESHDQESQASGMGNLPKFPAIGLGTFFDQMHRIFGELFQWFNEHFIESFLVVVVVRHDDEIDDRCRRKSTAKILK